MALMSISEVARQAGVRTSAIRYYEQIGVLAPAQRIGGQRRYDATALYRLAVIQRARRTGFRLDEIRQLFFGFGKRTSASSRWKKMCLEKRKELQQQVDQIQAMQRMLGRMEMNCHCAELEDCGRAMVLSTRGTGVSC